MYVKALWIIVITFMILVALATYKITLFLSCVALPLGLAFIKDLIK